MLNFARSLADIVAFGHHTCQVEHTGIAELRSRVVFLYALEIRQNLLKLPHFLTGSGIQRLDEPLLRVNLTRIIVSLLSVQY